MSSSTARDRRVACIRRDEEVIDINDHRLDELRRAEQQALQVLANANAELDAIRAERSAVQQRQDGLRQTLCDVRSQYRRDLWTNIIPLDILRCVFDELVLAPDDMWPEFGNGVVNATRTAVPFALTTVCSRWRMLALSVPTLWTYIAVQLDENEGISVPHERINEQLLRSKSASLDVLLQLRDADSEDRSDVVQMFVMLHRECHRFRRYECWLPNDITLCRTPTMDAFQAPTPALEHLAIIVPVDYGDEWFEETRDTYLPYTPKLKHLHFRRTGMSCSPQYATFSNLVSLQLWQSIPFDGFAVIARLAALTLESLSLSADWDLVHPIPPAVTFPRLSSVVLRTASPVLSHFIVAPKLKNLTLVDEAIVHGIGPFLRSVSQTVTTLTLSGGGILSADVNVVEALSNVENLAFSSSSATSYYVVWDNFFEALAHTSPPVWPMLQSLCLTEDVGELSPELGQGLLQFIRARALPPTSSSTNNETPRRLVDVRLDSPCVPEWLRLTVAHIMARE